MQCALCNVQCARGLLRLPAIVPQGRPRARLAAPPLAESCSGGQGGCWRGQLVPLATRDAQQLSKSTGRKERSIETRGATGTAGAALMSTCPVLASVGKALLATRGDSPNRHRRAQVAAR